MKIQLNFPKDNIHITNLAFIRALLIKCTIDKLDVSYEEREEIRRKILEYLKST